VAVLIFAKGARQTISPTADAIENHESQGGTAVPFEKKTLRITAEFAKHRPQIPGTWFQNAKSIRILSLWEWLANPTQGELVMGPTDTWIAPRFDAIPRDETRVMHCKGAMGKINARYDPV